MCVYQGFDFLECCDADNNLTSLAQVLLAGYFPFDEDVEMDLFRAIMLADYTEPDWYMIRDGFFVKKIQKGMPS